MIFFVLHGSFFCIVFQMFLVLSASLYVQYRADVQTAGWTVCFCWQNEKVM